MNKFEVGDHVLATKDNSWRLPIGSKGIVVTMGVGFNTKLDLGTVDFGDEYGTLSCFAEEIELDPLFQGSLMKALRDE